jgi:hypothetical protein
MKKLVSLFLAVMLVMGLSLGAFASTVTDDMYGDDKSASSNFTENQITNSLTEAGVTDVEADYWAAGSIVVMIEQGYLAPDSNGNINPNSSVPSSTAVAVFAKVLGIADKNDTTEQAVQKAKENGLVDATLPSQMTRLEFARMLATALGIQPASDVNPFSDCGSLSQADQKLLAGLYKAGVFKGYGDGSFGPDDVLTTAQLAVLVDRLLGSQ